MSININQDKVIDYFYNTIDDALLEGDFDWVDKLIAYTMRDSDTDTTILLSILTITLSARNKLKNREQYCKFCDKLFKDRLEEGSFNGRLMEGLW